MARIRAQLPKEVESLGIVLPDNNSGPIADLFKHWLRWIRSGSPLAAGDAASHDFFLLELRAHGRFESRPIVLDDRMQIHDGKHRLIAAFDFLDEHPERHFEVFWDGAP